jgi:hypothetical protein
MKPENNYQAVMQVNVPLQAAFESISQHIPQWWTANFEGCSEREGDQFTVTFGETFSTFVVSELIPDRRIVWLTKDCNLHFLRDKQEWKDTQIVWEFQEGDEGVRLTMTHVGLNETKECFTDCTGGWDHYVKRSLFDLLTKEKGQPDHADYSAKYKQ